MAKSKQMKSMKQQQVAKVPRPLPLDLPKGYHVHSFTRVRNNLGRAPSIVDSGLSWSFKFNDIPDYTDFTQLYDAYIIDKVEISTVLTDVYFSGNNTHYPTIFTAPDYDGDSVPSTSNDVTTKEGCTWTALTPTHNVHTITVRPRATTTVYRPGITAAYAWSPSNQLIDMNTVDVPFYGAVDWVYNFNLAAQPNALLSTVLTFHFRCVGQR